MTHRDPVCGMRVAEDKAAATFDYNGERYYFCAKSCAERFKADPARYLAAASPAPAAHPALPALPASPALPALPALPGGAALAGTVDYVCPMDPEVVGDHRGPCPV